MPTGQPRSASTAGPPPAPSSSGWSGSPSRSRTNRTTRWRSRSACGWPAAGTSSRPTSRSASTSASGASWPGSSASGRRPRPVAQGARHGCSPADRHGRIRCLSAAGRLRATRRAADGAGTEAADAFPAGATKLDDDIVGGADPGAPGARPQGLVREAAGHRRLARLRRRGAARLPRGRARAGSGSSPWPCPNRSSRSSRPRSSRRRRWRLPEDDVEEMDPGAGAGPHPRPRARRDRRRAGPAPGLATTELVRSLLAVTGETDRRRSCSTPRRSGRWPRWTAGGRASGGRPS